MKISRLLLLTFFIIFTVSCAAAPKIETGPDYEAGRRYAREFAKKDVQNVDCTKYPIRGYALEQADKHKQRLKSEGKSESFIEGFVYGYQLDFFDYRGVYCED